MAGQVRVKSGLTLLIQDVWMLKEPEGAIEVILRFECFNPKLQVDKPFSDSALDLIPLRNCFVTGDTATLPAAMLMPDIKGESFPSSGQHAYTLSLKIYSAGQCKISVQVKIFGKLLKELESLDFIPSNYKLTPGEWETRNYPIFESIPFGKKGNRQLEVPLPPHIWLTRAIQWTSDFEQWLEFTSLCTHGIQSDPDVKLAADLANEGDDLDLIVGPMVGTETLQQYTFRTTTALVHLTHTTVTKTGI
ncbi:hypothetical protein GG344DRAFT_66190 [Lentinula edodes]|nr:hypothetical protein GG344DRAFT_66190 [Lentinula edodes]